MSDLRRDFARAMSGIGFASPLHSKATPSLSGGNDQLGRENMQLVKAALCAGLYPNVIKARVLCQCAHRRLR